MRIKFSRCAPLFFLARCGEEGLLLGLLAFGDGVGFVDGLAQSGDVAPTDAWFAGKGLVVGLIRAIDSLSALRTIAALGSLELLAFRTIKSLSAFATLGTLELLAFGTIKSFSAFTATGTIEFLSFGTIKSFSAFTATGALELLAFGTIESLSAFTATGALGAFVMLGSIEMAR